MQYHVRELLNRSESEIWDVSPEHKIQMDDGEIIDSCQYETVYSHFFWQLFRNYPKAKILKKHHVGAVLKGDVLSADTHLKLCSSILKSIVEDEGLWLPAQKEPLLRDIYRVISHAMNQLSMITEENVTSLDILDFVEIANDPDIEQLRVETYQDTDRIKYAYEKTVQIIKSKPKFHDNGLSKAVRSKMVKENQVTQCVTFRGFTTEVDGAIFSTPNWSNYTFGNTRFYDFITDSRTAAKSHFYSDAALEDAEYMARKFQLFSTIVEKVVFRDCNSKRLVPWKVRGKMKDSAGTTIYSGDLGRMVGKYYTQDPEDHNYKIIEGNEEHLIGETIYFRSAMYCNEPNPHHICHVCAGKLSQNLSRFTNIGHLGSVTTTKETTQNILSIKHVNTSSTAQKVRLGEHEKKFMNGGPEGIAYYLNESLKSVKPQLTVLRDEAPSLIDIKLVQELDKINLTRISGTTLVRLSTKDTKRSFDVDLIVSHKNKASMMSRELLAYVKKKGWTTDEQNNFVFDLDEWDYKQPLFVLPNMEESFVDLAQQIDILVRSSKKMLDKRLIKDAPIILLNELFELVSSKFNINILSFEIIVYGLMVESSTSYAMGRNVAEPVLGIADQLTYYRSLGAGLAYEGIAKMLVDPVSFFPGRRPDSPMDVFLAPKEVVEAYRDKPDH